MNTIPSLQALLSTAEEEANAREIEFDETDPEDMETTFLEATQHLGSIISQYNQKLLLNEYDESLADDISTTYQLQHIARRYLIITNLINITAPE